MRICLDSNVLIDVCDGRAPELATLLRSALDAGRHSFPFTAAQIDEITFGDDHERSRARLRFLSHVSRDQYFIHSVHDLGFRTESPFSVWSTLNEVVVDPGAMHDLANLISYDKQRQAREQLGLDPRELNNLTPRGAIDRIEAILASTKAPPGVQVPRSLSDLLLFMEEINRKQFSELWLRMRANPEQMLVDKTIVGLFSLFDSLGFWSDERVTYEKGSRHADGRHAFNASHFDMLVTRDKRLLNKTAAVYEYLGLHVAVRSTEAFEVELREQVVDG